ncbi:MAG: hypothetical protein R3B46_10560 [Phycisphaerales bacterium]
MSRMMMIGLVSAMVAGGYKEELLPDMPEPEVRVQNIDIPGDLGETQRETDWSELVEYFNATNGGMSRVAANIDQLGDAASAELKSGINEVVSKMNEIRGKIMSAPSERIARCDQERDRAASGKLSEIRSQLVRHPGVSSASIRLFNLISPCGWVLAVVLAGAGTSGLEARSAAGRSKNASVATAKNSASFWAACLLSTVGRPPIDAARGQLARVRASGPTA